MPTNTPISQAIVDIRTKYPDFKFNFEVSPNGANVIGIGHATDRIKVKNPNGTSSFQKVKDKPIQTVLVQIQDDKTADKKAKIIEHKLDIDTIAANDAKVTGRDANQNWVFTLISSNGQDDQHILIWSADWFSKVFIYNAQTGAKVATIEVGGPVSTLYLFPNGNRLFINLAQYKGSDTEVWDIQNKQAPKLVAKPLPPFPAVFYTLPDQKHCIGLLSTQLQDVGSDPWGRPRVIPVKNELKIWDYGNEEKSGELLKNMQEGVDKGNGYNTFIATPDSKYLIAGTKSLTGGALDAFDISDPHNPIKYPMNNLISQDHEGKVDPRLISYFITAGMAITPCGKYVATCHVLQGGIGIVLWDITNRAQPRKIGRTSCKINKFSFDIHMHFMSNPSTSAAGDGFLLFVNGLENLLGVDDFKPLVQVSALQSAATATAAAPAADVKAESNSAAAPASSASQALAIATLPKAASGVSAFAESAATAVVSAGTQASQSAACTAAVAPTLLKPG